jgi:CheY-like chemotaxis protein
MPTVLIIDDNADLRTLTRLMLERMDCQAVSARNGIEGISLAMKTNPQLILLDIMMDELNGFDTCRQLRLSGYTGRIVLMSAIPEKQGQRDAQACGADDYVEKPLTSWTLADQIALLPATAADRPNRQ